MKSDYLQTALAYHRAGHHVLPVNEDKTPAIQGSWRQYQTAQTEDDVTRLFSAPHWGVAILTGINGLEVIDIDCKYDLTGKLEVDFMLESDKLNENAPAIVNLAVSRTKSGGYHVYYRCTTPEGSKKLAMRPGTEKEQADGDKKLVLIETKGVGGYVVVAPSPGYEMQCGDLLNIPTITQGARDTILSAARSFDQLPEIEYTPAPKASYTPPPTGESVTPWDDFNDRNTPIDILQQYGWSIVYRHGEKVFLKRPGKTDAKTSGNYHEGRKLFVCHTTSTCLPAEKGLTAWSIYKHYAHNGDAHAAAKQLYADGFGTRYEGKAPIQPSTKVETPEQAEEKVNDLLTQVWATRFDFFAPIKEEDAILMHHNYAKDKTYKVAGYGQICVVVGAEKSGKTFLLRHIIASALAGGNPFLNFSLKLKPGQNILYFDTEQSEYFFKFTQREIQELAGVQNPVNYYAFHLRRFSKSERLQALKAIVEQIPNIGCIVVDGIVDLCHDFMDAKHSEDTVQELLTISDVTKALVIPVLHLTKKDGFMRGHLGTALQNKVDCGLEVHRDSEGEYYTVKSRLSRFAPFMPFDFRRDPETGRAIRDSREVSYNNQPTAQDIFAPSAPIPALSGAMVAGRPDDKEEIPF